MICMDLIWFEEYKCSTGNMLKCSAVDTPRIKEVSPTSEIILSD